MIVFIAGRLFPFFIERSLKGVIIPRSRMPDNLAIGSTIVVMFGYLLFYKRK
jgi:uncharacterized protein involved in response to NO